MLPDSPIRKHRLGESRRLSAELDGRIESLRARATKHAERGETARASELLRAAEEYAKRLDTVHPPPSFEAVMMGSGRLEDKENPADAVEAVAEGMPAKPKASKTAAPLQPTVTVPPLVTAVPLVSAEVIKEEQKAVEATRCQRPHGRAKGMRIMFRRLGHNAAPRRTPLRASTFPPIPTDPESRQPTQTASPPQPATTAEPPPPTKTTAPLQPTMKAPPQQPTKTEAPLQPMKTTASVQPMKTAAPLQSKKTAAPLQRLPAPLQLPSPQQAAAAPTLTEVERTVEQLRAAISRSSSETTARAQLARVLSKEGAPKLRSLYEHLEGIRRCSPLMAYDRACLRDAVVDILVTMSC